MDFQRDKYIACAQCRRRRFSYIINAEQVKSETVLCSVVYDGQAEISPSNRYRRLRNKSPRYDVITS